MEASKPMTNDLTNLVNRFSGNELKVVIAQLSVASMVFRNESGHVTGYGGYMYEQLVWISLHLNFSLAIEVSKDNAFGIQLENGTWTGMRGLLQNKEIDIACTAYSGVGSNEIMELAIYIAGSGYGILTQYPNPRTSNFGHMKIFSPQVWIGLLISILVCIGCIKLFTVLTNKYNQNNDNSNGFDTLSEISMYIFGSLTNQGGMYRDSQRRVIGIIAVFWCFATFCFVNIYSSCLTSYMSLTYQRPEINTFQDLATNPNYQMTTFKGSTAEEVFLESKSGPMKDIGDKLRRCPDDSCSLNDVDKVVNKVLGKDRFVATLPDGLLGEFVFRTLSNNKCRLTAAQEVMAYRHYFMGVQKNSPFLAELNKASLWWFAFGLQGYWERKLVRSAPQCMLKYNSHGESVQMVDGKARLKLEQFYVPFAVLFIGYVLALTQFLRERFLPF